MAKIGISLPDELCAKLDAAAKDEGRTVSGLIAEALIAYFARDGKTTSAPPVPASSNPAPQSVPPAANPSPQPSVPSSTGSSADLQYALSQIRDLTAKSTENTATTNEILQTVGELDERLSKLWHDVHDQQTSKKIQSL